MSNQARRNIAQRLIHLSVLGNGDFFNFDFLASHCTKMHQSDVLWQRSEITTKKMKLKHKGWILLVWYLKFVFVQGQGVMMLTDTADATETC